MNRLKSSFYRLLFCLLFFVSAAASFAQITFNAQNQKIRQVIRLIEKNSTYSFFYNNDLPGLDKTVTINAKDQNIESILKQIFQGTGINYKIDSNKQIALTLKSNEKQEDKGTIAGNSHKVAGTIVDAKTGEALPGVTIVLSGTQTGTISDIDGRFLMNVPANSTLDCSYIGYARKKISTGKQSELRIAMDPDMKVFDEVVVVGYGTQKKVNLTGAVSNINIDDLSNRPLTNASLALQGTAAGVYALQSSGKPGDDNTVIDIRGVGTFGDNSPLVIVDGFPGNLSDVNPSDIKSLTVLKDAASASIYGNRAANGVILITTKKGAAGTMKVNYNGYFGVQKATRLPKTLNSVEYATLHNEASTNSGRVLTYSDGDIAKYAAHNDAMYPDVNYFDVYYSSASTQNHRFSMTGGTENLQFAFMLGHLKQDGILVATNYKKTDFRSNIDAFFMKDKRLRISTKLAGNLGVKGEPTSVWNATWYATLAPIYPLKNEAGEYMSVNGELNPYAEISTGSTTKTNRYNFSGQMEAEYKIFGGLSAQVTYGYDAMISKKNAFNANVALQNKDGSIKTESSDLTVTNETDIQTMLTALLKYGKTFGKHDLNLLAGYSEEEFTYDWENGYRKNFVNNTQRVLSLGDAATQTNNAGSYDLGLRSYFGRVNYVYDSKYLFEANIRRDASSRFAKGHQWGTFPSFSAGWLMSSENFLKDAKWLNSLKVRASWGQLGSQNISSYYNGSDVLASGQNYSFGSTLYSGVAITALTNKDLTWETSQQLNFGVDLSLKNGFDLTADFFDKRTKNLLLSRPIPLTMAASAPYVNAGEVQNKGIEASLTYRKNLSNGMKFVGTFNASHIVNKITRMNAPEQISSPKAIKVGYAINSFYGYQMDGIYQTSDFDYVNGVYTLKPGVVSVANYTAQPGDIKFKDQNADGVVDMDNDRKVIGKQFPDLTYSLNLSMQWKNFDLGLFWQGVQGIQGYFYYELATPFSGVANLGSWWLNRWTPTNPSNTMPRVTLDEYRTNVHSSFYMEDASYLRLKNIELGYTLDSKLTSKLGFGSVRVYGNIQNALTFTKFKGFDPEQTIDQTRAEAFPQVRVMTMGINVNF